MNSKIITAIGATSLILGMFALEGCFESHYPGYGGGYGYGPTYYGQRYYAQPAPVIVGDYDEHRTWHDRDWWVNNRRDWVNDHHKEWLGHSNDRDHDVHTGTRDRNDDHDRS